MEVYSGFVYRERVKLNQLFFIASFLDKKESCNKLVVLKYFSTWYVNFDMWDER